MRDFARSGRNDGRAGDTIARTIDTLSRRGAAMNIVRNRVHRGISSVRVDKLRPTDIRKTLTEADKANVAFGGQRINGLFANPEPVCEVLHGQQVGISGRKMTGRRLFKSLSLCAGSGCELFFVGFIICLHIALLRAESCNA